MVAGTSPFMSLYLDMDLGTVTPTYATPERAERIMKSNEVSWIMDPFETGRES